MPKVWPVALLTVSVLSVLVVSTLPACSGQGEAAAGRPTIVVTTSILGDVVARVLGDAADVVTIMPVGVDPHDFQASAREIDEMQRADALVVNGGGFEAGLVDVVDAGPGRRCAHLRGARRRRIRSATTPTSSPTRRAWPMWSSRSPRSWPGTSPQIWRPGCSSAPPATRRAPATPTLRSWRSLRRSPQDHRVMVTNHEVFGYFAARYGFEVVGRHHPERHHRDGARRRRPGRRWPHSSSSAGVPAIFADGLLAGGARRHPVGRGRRRRGRRAVHRVARRRRLRC